MTDFKTYANSFQAIARLELEGITTLLDYLSHPERDLKFIHVAGTNGKGSVCAFLQKILTHAGYKCGKYISPNLISVNERISIDDKEISDKELCDVLKTVEIASEKVKNKLGDAPTQFEIWTAAAFIYFKEKNCDIVILETGLGGSRDATNVIPSPIASVITGIAKDHMSYLGNTLAQIASQKAGIIKKGGFTVTCRQVDEVENVLKKACEKTETPLYISDSAIVENYRGMNEVMTYRGMSDLEIGIPGIHQIENACIAAETALRLNIPEESIRYGLKTAKNPGRLELIEKNPTVIFDGAHNPNGAAALSNNLKRYFPGQTPVFIMGAMADKDISGMAKALFSEYKKTTVYTVAVCDNPRSESAEKLAEKLSSSNITAVACKNMRTAYDAALEKGGLVVICGSLYLYKDLKEMPNRS